MIGVVLRKEYHEHRPVWAALGFVAAAVLLGVGLGWGFTGPGGVALRDAMRVTALVLAWTYGVVCGSMLLAGEAEAGTQPWLDTLPGGRRRLWRAKFLSGAILVLAQTALIFAVSASVGLSLEKGGWPGWLGALLGSSLVGYGWGLLCSAQARTALEAIALAILAQIAAGPFVGVATAALAGFLHVVGGLPPPVQTALVVVASAAIALAPFPLSAVVYARDDLRRGGRDGGDSGWWEGARQALRLAWMQSRGLLLGVVLGSLIGGLFVAAGFGLLWPLLSLAVGALCGATAFLDEQGGSYRFLGDQRFPLTRIWLAKLLVHATMAILGCLALLLPALFLRSAHDPRTPLAQGEALLGGHVMWASSPAAFLVLWPSYGFAVGHLCGLLFRKPLVAVVVSLGAALLAAVAWAPSLVAGGLWPWQVLLTPLILILASRWVLRPWAAGRLASWGGARRVAAVLLLCAAATALAVWSRVAEVPDVEGPEGFQAYVDALPAPGEDEAGRVGRDALGRVKDLGRAWVHEPMPAKLFPEEEDTHPRFVTQVGLAARRGWPDGAEDLGKRLDTIFDDPIWEKFERLRDLPPGLIDDPRRMTFGSLDSFDLGELAADLLAARGLQMQKAKGRPEVFVSNLEAALALARGLENRSRRADPPRIEATFLAALNHWLAGLGDDAPLLRRALAALRKHRAGRPADRTEARYTAYLIARNSLAKPHEWLRAGSEVESAFAEVALQVPWERERLQRQVRYIHWGADAPAWPLTSPLLWRDPPKGQATRPDLRPICRLDAMTLVVALRLYQAEKGKPARSLDALVPAHLPSVPEDPFAKAPFRYRLSKGEEIVWPDDAPRKRAAGGTQPPGVPGMPGDPVPEEKEPVRSVKAGQGVVWSVGEDRSDDGGKRRCPESEMCGPGEDLIFLVPPPKK